MDNVIGIEIMRACSKVEDAVRTLEEWFYQHGRWIFTSRYDTVQKLLGKQIPDKNSDLKSLSKYADESDNWSKSRLFCWLQECGIVTRMAMFEDSLDATFRYLSIGRHLLQDGELEIFAVRIDPLFTLANTSLEEFNTDRQLCYRKCIEHGEQILERMIGSNFNDTIEEVVVFPSDCPINEPPRWFVVPCVDKSVGECLGRALSCDFSKLQQKTVQTSLCVSDLLKGGYDWNLVSAMKIFVPSHVFIDNKRSSYHAT